MTRRERQQLFRDRYVRPIRDRYAGPCGWLWTPGEDAIAADMRARDKSYAQIGMKLHRTPDAVAARLRYIGERS